MFTIPRDYFYPYKPMPLSLFGPVEPPGLDYGDVQEPGV
jgi:hypothetical protein